MLKQSTCGLRFDSQSCFATDLKLLKPVDTKEVSKGIANGIIYCKDEQKYKMQIGAFLDKCRYVIQCLSNSWNNLEMWYNTFHYY